MKVDIFWLAFRCLLKALNLLWISFPCLFSRFSLKVACPLSAVSHNFSLSHLLQRLLHRNQFSSIVRRCSVNRSVFVVLTVVSPVHSPSRFRVFCAIRRARTVREHDRSITELGVRGCKIWFFFSDFKILLWNRTLIPLRLFRISSTFCCGTFWIFGFSFSGSRWRRGGWRRRFSRFYGWKKFFLDYLKNFYEILNK